MNITLRRRYLVGPDDSHSRGKPWRGGRGSGHGSSNSGSARSKGLKHPIGFSGRTLGQLTRRFRDR